MPDKTYKIIEVVGSSPESIQQAVRNAISKAQRTLRHLDWFEVANVRGRIENGKPIFQVEVRIGFNLEDKPVT